MDLIRPVWTLAQMGREPYNNGGGGGAIFCCAVAGLVLVVFGFWIWMLVHAIRNPRLSDSERITWVLVILLLGPILGAPIYLFFGRSGRNQ